MGCVAGVRLNVRRDNRAGRLTRTGMYVRRAGALLRMCDADRSGFIGDSSGTCDRVSKT